MSEQATEPLYDIISRSDAETGARFFDNAKLATGLGIVEFTNGEAHGVPESVAKLLTGRGDLRILPAEGEGAAAAPISLEPDVVVPEGVVPGMTPGWPIGEDGKPLRLSPLERYELAVAAAKAAGLDPSVVPVPKGLSEQEREAQLAAAREFLEAEGMEVPTPPADDAPTIGAAQLTTTPPPADPTAPADPAEFGGNTVVNADDTTSTVRITGGNVVEPGVNRPADGTASTTLVGSPTGGREPAEQDAKPLVLPQGFEAQTGEGEPRCIAAKADKSQCKNAAKGATHACALAAHQASVQEYLTTV